MILQLKELQQALQKLGFLREAQETQNVLEGVMPSFDWLNDAEVLKRFMEYLSKYTLADFIEDNSEILSQFDVKKYLGSGANGDAWLLEDGKVLKIGRGDSSEYKSLQSQLFKNKASKNIPMIYEVGDFETVGTPDDFNKENFFYVIMEYTPSFSQKMQEHQKLSPQAEEIWQYFENNMDKILQIMPALAREIPDLTDEYKSNKRIFEFLKTYMQEVVWQLKVFVSGKMRGQLGVKKATLPEIIQNFHERHYDLVTFPIKHFLGLPNNWEEKLLESFYNNIMLQRHDLHSGNFGFRDEDVVFYDG